jgi:hypothetical protein
MIFIMKLILFLVILIPFTMPLIATTTPSSHKNTYQIIKTSTDLTSTDKKIKHIAYTLSIKFTSIFEDALKNNIIKEKELFSTLYFPLTPLSASPKFTTFYDKFIDKNISPIQNQSLLEHPSIIFIVLVDKNGYLPSHNKDYTSKPLSSPLNRTKRIFNDRTGLLAARNTSGFILQNYSRDTGEQISDLSVPIFILGKHWGAIRIGYKRN